VKKPTRYARLRATQPDQFHVHIVFNPRSKQWILLQRRLLYCGTHVAVYWRVSKKSWPNREWAEKDVSNYPFDGKWQFGKPPYPDVPVVQWVQSPLMVKRGTCNACKKKGT
jgi:hypothetical protein